MKQIPKKNEAYIQFAMAWAEQPLEPPFELNFAELEITEDYEVWSFCALPGTVFERINLPKECTVFIFKDGEHEKTASANRDEAKAQGIQVCFRGTWPTYSAVITTKEKLPPLKEILLIGKNFK